MVSFISREPMTLTKVMAKLQGWKPFKARTKPLRDPWTGEFIACKARQPVKSRKPVALNTAAGLTNGKHYAWGGEFTATDGKVHIWFDFFAVSGPNGDGAREFEEKLDLVSDCSTGPDVDVFYALAGPENTLTLIN